MQRKLRKSRHVPVGSRVKNQNGVDLQPSCPSSRSLYPARLRRASSRAWLRARRSLPAVAVVEARVCCVERAHERAVLRPERGRLLRGRVHVHLVPGPEGRGRREGRVQKARQWYAQTTKRSTYTGLALNVSQETPTHTFHPDFDRVLLQRVAGAGFTRGRAGPACAPGPQRAWRRRASRWSAL